MAVSRGQRIGIWVAAIAMAVGTIGGFIAMMVAPQNEARDLAEQQQYQQDYAKYQAERAAQADQLAKKYRSLYQRYEKVPAKFSADSVKKLTTRDLKKGDGATITGETKFAAYYIGWNPKGKVFDQSLKDGELGEPLYRSNQMTGMIGLDQGLDQATLIEGWKEGLKGMKVGGVRELTIPADQAYGEAGGGEDIPANTPLKFIIMTIPALEEIKEPVMPQSVIRAAGQAQQ